MANYIFFPQADDLNKILDLANIEDPQNIKNEPFVQVLLGDLADRQARYYIHALKYLGLLDDEKNFTDKGLSFREMSSFAQEAELIRTILSDQTIGTIFIKERLIGSAFTRDEIAYELEKGYPGFSEATYFRRATNVRAWIEWVKEKLELQ